MQLVTRFNVSQPRDDVVALLCRDETLLGLFPGETEIIARDGDSRTTRTHYRALGREGDATFHYTFLMDGNVAFEKVCDGHVWRELAGSVVVDETAEGAVIAIEMSGRTKTLVPEFTIKGPMEEQLAHMSAALRELLEGADSGAMDRNGES